VKLIELYYSCHGQKISSPNIAILTSSSFVSITFELHSEHCRFVVKLDQSEPCLVRKLNRHPCFPPIPAFPIHHILRLSMLHTLPRLFNTTHRHLSAMSRLTNKTILITGASSGIGRSTAYEFSRTAPNIRLILTARRIDTLRQIATDLETSSGGRTKVLPLRFDVSSPSEARGFLSTLPENWRDIDVLVNNAGLVKGADKVGEIKEEDIDVMMMTNVLGLINVRAPSLPHPLSFTRR